jgi:hypothetical protein
MGKNSMVLVIQFGNNTLLTYCCLLVRAGFGKARYFFGKAFCLFTVAKHLLSP